MGLVPCIAGNLRLGHQSTESTGHALFPGTSKCTMKAWGKTTPSDVRVSCYASLHIFSILGTHFSILGGHYCCFPRCWDRKEPEEVFLIFPSIFSNFHGQILHLLAPFSIFSKVTLFDTTLKKQKQKQKQKNLHLFHLLFQAISLYDLFLPVMNRCYYLCFSI